MQYLCCSSNDNPFKSKTKLKVYLFREVKPSEINLWCNMPPMGRREKHLPMHIDANEKNSLPTKDINEKDVP